MRQLKITKQITNRESQSIEKYLQEIGKEELITAEEEVELARRIQEGDTYALERLTKANLRFVVSVSKQYQNQGLSLNDLINEGNLGLIKAAMRFDETRGFKFISYAVWWIRQSILQALAEHARIIRLPANKVGTLNKLNRTFAQLEQEFEREPTEDELADVLDMTTDEVVEYRKSAGKPVSLDAPIGDEDEGSMLNVLEDKQSGAPSDELMNDSLKSEIDRVLQSLAPREATILKHFFGLGGEEYLSFEDIGAKLGLSRERVRQLKEKAIAKLRKSSNQDILRNYLGK